MSKPKVPLGPTLQSLPIALNRARERIMEPIREMLSETGLTEQQWRILRVLEEAGPLDATTLADRASLLLPSQTRIVATLVEKGLVTRVPDKTDRRRQTVAITPSGVQVLTDNAAQARAIAERTRAVLGPDRHALLLELLAEVDAKL